MECQMLCIQELNKDEDGNMSIASARINRKMDEYYEGVQDYADKALMSPDDLMTILPTEYSNYHNNLVISSDHQNHHYGVPILYNSQVGGGS
ncbi:hypothetical protein Leryth_016195 [Lithospermum erythrorhizon]|nr:hypothetical protein Leryth_016195 [Lithospermum erythrorhizon]